MKCVSPFIKVDLSPPFKIQGVGEGWFISSGRRVELPSRCLKLYSTFPHPSSLSSSYHLDSPPFQRQTTWRTRVRSDVYMHEVSNNIAWIPCILIKFKISIFQLFLFLRAANWEEEEVDFKKKTKKVLFFSFVRSLLPLLYTFDPFLSHILFESWYLDLRSHLFIPVHCLIVLSPH